MLFRFFLYNSPRSYLCVFLFFKYTRSFGAFSDDSETFLFCYFIALMDSKLIEIIQQDSIKDERAEIKTGMEVEVSIIIKEGAKERIQKFKGLVIKTHGKTKLDKTIVVRKDVDGVGIEKIFPIYSPAVQKIEVLRSFKVRRNNITFIRGLRGKAARLKEVK